MYRLTTDLLARVAALVDDHREFFAAAREWYSDVTLANRAARLLLARSSAGARVAVAVNRQQLAGDAGAVAAGAQSLRWTLPVPPVGVGDHDVYVGTDPGGKRLYLRAVSAAQDGGLGPQLLDFTRRTPEPTAYLALGAAHDAKFDGDVWVVQPGGGITLRLRLVARAPVALVLTLLNEEVTAADVIDVLQSVAEKVQKLRRRLADERAGRPDPARAARLDADLADLDAYAELHARQLDPAFRGPDGGTLRDVIARTDDPDHLADGGRARARPVEMMPPVERPRDDRRRPDRPRRPRPTRPPYPDAQAAPAGGGGAALSCLAALFGGALVVAGLGFATWSLLRPDGGAAGAGGAGDDITARVRAAGGNQSGPLVVSLLWDDKNDLDLHVVGPTGEKVWFMNRRAAGGVLDVDRNALALGLTDAPVENVSWAAAPPPGRYRVFVNFFAHHEAAGAPRTTRYVVRVLVDGRPRLYPGSVTHDPDADGDGVLAAEFDVPGT